MWAHIRAKLVYQVIAFAAQLLFDLAHIARNLAKQINHVHQARLYFFRRKINCAAAFVKAIKRRLRSLKVGLELSTTLYGIPAHQQSKLRDFVGNGFDAWTAQHNVTHAHAINSIQSGNGCRTQTVFGSAIIKFEFFQKAQLIHPPIGAKVAAGYRGNIVPFTAQFCEHGVNGRVEGFRSYRF